ncbi:MAG: hypothetical protein MO853_06655 [Candidatus Protistobacter heckmanni]|nr:hypothetical protein [Candidatus Protistobacter heckmanni]
MATLFSRPYANLWMGAVRGAVDARFAAVSLPEGPRNAAVIARAAEGLEGVTVVDKPAGIARLFGKYRELSSIWLLLALAAVLALLFWRYGRKDGLRAQFPVALVLGLTLACLGYAGRPLTLFHWMALKLVLGVGVNYSMFLREGMRCEDVDLGAVAVGVVLSAATTQLSFGLLALSAMPALSSFGLALLIGINLALLFTLFSLEPDAVGEARA